MKKIFFYIGSLLLLSSVWIGCSDETGNFEKNISVEEFRQKCMSMATEYGIEVIFNNEYIMERINWSDERLRAEMKYVAEEFERTDTMDISSDEEHLRRRTIGRYEQGTYYYRYIDDDFTVNESIGINTYTISGHLTFTELGSVLTISNCTVVCRHNCNNDSCEISNGTYFPRNSSVKRSTYPIPGIRRIQNGQAELGFSLSWEASFDEDTLNVISHTSNFRELFDYVLLHL